ncbi:MAG TPA: DUF2249 domain-containing protein [Rubrivivax sp.]|nr:DUF2249 domain-containing protein [Burkholderiales bacterium]HNT39885.1 DUF2249 domain-containing protein [Rubrivivax sp.]
MSGPNPTPPDAPAPATLDGDGCWRLDLRGLPPPQPMVTILRHLEQHADDGRALLVRLERDPVMLYPELAERGWCAETLSDEPGDVRLRLQRA